MGQCDLSIPSSGYGFISAMSYCGNMYDFLFVPSEVKGSSVLPVGDCFVNGRMLLIRTSICIGGHRRDEERAGAFAMKTVNTTAYSGGRLVYIPNNVSERGRLM